MSATGDLKAIYDACAARDTRLEGIEMLLELEDLVDEPRPIPAFAADGARLAALEAEALRGETDRDVQLAAEVAAARDFGIAS